MPNSELEYYIQQQLDNNISREQINAVLKQQGWDDAAIEQAFADLLVKLEIPFDAKIDVDPAPINPQAVLHSNFAKPVGTIATVTTSKISFRRSIAWRHVFLIGISIVLLATLVGATVHWGMPYFTLMKAGRDLVAAESVRATVLLHNPEPDTQPIRIEAQLHTDPQAYNRVLVEGSYENEDMTAETFALDTVFRSTQWYLKPAYSGMAALEQQMVQALPVITTLPTYQTIQDIFYGDLWVLANLDEQKDVITPLSPSAHTDLDLVELAKQSALLFKLNEYEKSIDAKGNPVHVYQIGIHKKALAVLVDTKLRSMDSEMTTSEINQLVATIDSIDGWEDNLITLTVDAQSGQIAQIDIRLPNSNGVVLPEAPTSAAESESGEFDVSGMARSLVASILEKPTSSLQPIANITLDQHNQVPNVTPPLRHVDLEVLAPDLMRDWGPLIFSMMGAAFAEEDYSGSFE